MDFLLIDTPTLLPYSPVAWMLRVRCKKGHDTPFQSWRRFSPYKVCLLVDERMVF